MNQDQSQPAKATTRTSTTLSPDLFPSYPDLAGKVAVVTGGSRGIGAETCRRLAQNGVKVAVSGRDERAIANVVSSVLMAGGEAVGVAADVTTAEGVEDLREAVERDLGPVDILTVFAGGHGDPQPLEQLSEERWRFVLDANLTSKFLTVRSFLPGMVERQRGAIILMSSSAGRLVGGASVAYAAAQAGAAMFARHVAQEVGRHGVRVNSVAPSAVVTDRLRAAPEGVRQQLAAGFPLGRLGEVEDVALATLFLASDASSWLTGVTLDVAGGRVML